MTVVNKNYFSEISKLVNSELYNHASQTFQPNVLKVDLATQLASASIKQALSVDNFCVLQLPDDMRNEYLQLLLANILGEIFIDKNPEKRSYATVQADEHARFYINSNLAQPMHTDEGYATRYPRYVALHCIQQSQDGGESILVLFNDLYENLIEQFGNKVALLFERNAITIHCVNGLETKPILFQINENEIGITYSTVLKKMWCSEEVFWMFDYITQYVHCEKNQKRFFLKPGQLLIFDNRKVIHGRSKFSNTERLLHRYWFDECNL